MTVKRLFLAAMTTAALTAHLVSCTDYDMDMDYSDNKIQYAQSFYNKFGNVDPNHTWGFGDITGDKGTRAQVPNKNEWQDIYHMQVPGWPDTYHTIYDNELHGTDSYHNIGGSGNIYESVASSEPAGDVTDEEIQYVAWWFRTHRYPTSLYPHWSDFYIQEVCADNDRDSEGNAIRTANEYALQPDGSWKWRAEGVSTFTIDQLKVKSKDQLLGYDGNPIVDQDGVPEEYDHIYNFNSGHSNHLASIDQLSMDKGTYKWTDADKMEGYTNKRLIDFYQSSGTEDFSAHYSNDQKWRSNYLDRNIWVLVHLHFVGKSGRIYDGYYLGFDYTFFKTFEDGDGKVNKYQFLEPDGYYSNWILKVNPGRPIENSGFTRRIMCEDLGNSDDLDFNDVVFDATFNMTQDQLDSYVPGTEVDVTITLQAAGATMPIWVGKDPDQHISADYEVHDLFNVPVSRMVNTDNNMGVNAIQANYHVKLKSINPDDIGIYVYNNKVNEWQSISRAVDNYNSADKASRTPQKFAVPATTLWLKERISIEEGYPHFADWVHAEHGAYREKENDDQASASWIGAWFNEGKVARNIMGVAGNNTTAMEGTGTSDEGIYGTTSSSAGFTYTIKADPNNKDWGTVSIGSNTGYGTYSVGTNVVVTATPKPGQNTRFVGWNDDTEEVKHPATRTVTVDAMKYLLAYFVKDYTARATVNDASMGSASIVSATMGGDSYDVSGALPTGTRVQLLATPNAGYELEGWYINGELRDESPSFGLDIQYSDLVVEARFRVAQTYE